MNLSKIVAKKTNSARKENLLRKTFPRKVEGHICHLAQGLTLQKSYLCPKTAVIILAMYKLQ